MRYFLLLLLIPLQALALDLSVFANYAMLETTETGGDTNVRSAGGDLALSSNVHIVGMYGEESGRDSGSVVTGTDAMGNPIYASTDTPALDEFIRADIRIGQTSGPAFFYVAPSYVMMDLSSNRLEKLGFAAGLTVSSGNFYGGFEYFQADSLVNGITASLGLSF